MKGGYKVINLKGVALTSGTAATIAGSYAAAANPYGKATIVSGLVVGSVAYPEFYAPFAENAGTYSASVAIGESTITIAIADGDGVTVTVA